MDVLRVTVGSTAVLIGPVVAMSVPVSTVTEEDIEKVVRNHDIVHVPRSIDVEATDGEIEEKAE